MPGLFFHERNGCLRWFLSWFFPHDLNAVCTITLCQCFVTPHDEYLQHPSTLRPHQSPCSHWAESGQHDFRPRQGGFGPAAVEHARWPGCSRPPLQGQLELDRSRTALCFIPDQEEEDSQRGEDWWYYSCSEHLLSSFVPVSLHPVTVCVWQIQTGLHMTVLHCSVSKCVSFRCLSMHMNSVMYWIKHPGSDLIRLLQILSAKHCIVVSFHFQMMLMAWLQLNLNIWLHCWYLRPEAGLFNPWFPHYLKIL